MYFKSIYKTYNYIYILYLMMKSYNYDFNTLYEKTLEYRNRFKALEQLCE